MDHFDRKAISRASRESMEAVAAARLSCDDTREHIRHSKSAIDRSLKLLRLTARA